MVNTVMVNTLTGRPRVAHSILYSAFTIACNKSADMATSSKSSPAFTPQSRILNGWKEIARYLNRGVRTVQRWERELGCPVRRPKNRGRSAVIALSEEIDGWIRSTTSGRQDESDVTATLKKRVTQLERENERLRAALERAQRGEVALTPEQVNPPAIGRTPLPPSVACPRTRNP